MALTKYADGNMYGNGNFDIISLFNAPFLTGVSALCHDYLIFLLLLLFAHTVYTIYSMASL